MSLEGACTGEETGLSGGGGSTGGVLEVVLFAGSSGFINEILILVILIFCDHDGTVKRFVRDIYLMYTANGQIVHTYRMEA